MNEIYPDRHLRGAAAYIRWSPMQRERSTGELAGIILDYARRRGLGIVKACSAPASTPTQYGHGGK